MESMSGSRRADLLILSLAGAFVGWSREREVRMRDELSRSNRLLRRDLLRVAQALTQAVEAKDAYTEGHLRRVSEYAVAVGRGWGCAGRTWRSSTTRACSTTSASSACPSTVLRKEGPLDDLEAEIMRRHPEIGARMLEKLELLSDAAPLVLHHQERFDGDLDGELSRLSREGSPGESIPLGARIIAVVDAFDAMTTTRPYRAALPAERPRSPCSAGRAGRQFDPRVVDAFLKSPRRAPVAASEAILALERPWTGARLSRPRCAAAGSAPRWSRRRYRPVRGLAARDAGGAGARVRRSADLGKPFAFTAGIAPVRLVRPPGSARGGVPPPRAGWRR